MRAGIFTVGGAALACLALVTAGCGRSAPAPTADIRQTEATKPKATPADDEVRVARAEAPVLPPVEATGVPEPSENVPPQVAPALEVGSPQPAKLPQASAKIPFGEMPEDELTMPRVSLSEAHAKACRVRVGDSFPELELPDLAGGSKTIASLRGSKLTLVVFWNGRKATARQQLGDLTPEVSARFSSQGLAVVGVNSGDDPQRAKELAEQAHADFTVLSDRDGSALEEVAPGKVPATYLLDDSGKILWFDIEYSLTTRRELVQAIRFVLARR